MLIFCIIAGMIVAYILFGRKWLKSMNWTAPFFEFIEPYEIWLYSKSETILWSRILMVAGVVPVLLEQFQALNSPDLLAFIPDKYKPYATLSFTICGVISEICRRNTTQPLVETATPDKEKAGG